MNNLYSTIFIGVLISVGFKIIWSWIRQVQKQFINNIPTPGIPWPILGHSHLFLNVSPQDVLNVCVSWVKQDKRQRKVISYFVLYQLLIPVLKCRILVCYRNI